MMKQKKSVVVIGSGFGGLTTAIKLLNKGFQVTVLEKNEQIGGRASVLEKNGFKFDMGPTVITVPEIFRSLFEESGKNLDNYVELLPVYPFYRIYFDDKSKFDYGTPEDNIRQIKELEPEDLNGYRRMLKDIEPIYKKGYLELATKPFLTVFSMLKIAPLLFKLKGYLTNYQFVSRYVQNNKLRQVFSFHPLLIGGNPFSVPSIYSLIQYIEKEYGIWYPRGGTGRLVKSMGQLIEELGGEIKLNSEVVNLEITDKRVTGVMIKSGEVLHPDFVVSNADVATTYTKLIDKRWRKKNSNKRYEKAKYSMSLFLIYFGTKKKYPEMKHHTIILGPRYKGLLEDIFKKKILADDFSSYLHVPSLTDPEMAPKGHEAFYILVPVPNLDADINWKEMGAKLKTKVLNFLDEFYLEGLLENLVVDEIFTPNDFATRYQSYKGTGFSLEPTMRQSAYFRPHNRSEDITNLYISGAGTHPGAGLPGVVASGEITANLIDEDAHA